MSDHGVVHAYCTDSVAATVLSVAELFQLELLADSVDLGVSVSCVTFVDNGATLLICRILAKIVCVNKVSTRGLLMTTLLITCPHFLLTDWVQEERFPRSSLTKHLQQQTVDDVWSLAALRCKYTDTKNCGSTML